MILDLGVIVGALTSVVTIAGLLATLVGHVATTRKQFSSDRTLIGIPPGVHVPASLKGLPMYSSLRQAQRSAEKKSLVLMSSVSRALRSCDFVIVDPIADTKLIVVGSDIGDSRLSML